MAVHNVPMPVPVPVKVTVVVWGVGLWLRGLGCFSHGGRGHIFTEVFIIWDLEQIYQMLISTCTGLAGAHESDL